MNDVLETLPLGFPWVTVDPFLFCVHHVDAYPAGNEAMGPLASLDGRDLGQDFGGKDGWRMYHGRTVPGFPQHPHRGFETVTIVRRGYIDHSDSLGATARFGHGDTQWLTAGKGISHCEMFPLVKKDEPNPVELFQIWLNLPPEDKMAEPHFAMLWSEDLPRVSRVDENGRRTDVMVVAGELDGKRPPPAPPRSWASRAEADVAIWCLTLEPHATFTLPPAKGGEETIRTLFFFAGKSLRVGGEAITKHAALVVRTDKEVKLEAGEEPVELLLLQGKPIGAPVVAHGPFVMNTKEEVQQAFLDYRKTQFGGWPWPSDDPCHPREEGRFAKQDGKLSVPSGTPSRGDRSSPGAG
jgi:redox-sensitive bicupin YhaK (pirin superfamily)